MARAIALEKELGGDKRFPKKGKNTMRTEFLRKGSLGMGDARLERATFGSGDQRSIHLS
jgi:hypothetical protein